MTRKQTAEDRAAIPPRPCPCGRGPALNRTGVPSCGRCRDEFRAARNAKIKAARDAKRPDPVCTRCGIVVAHDPGEPRRRIHPECKDLPSPAKAAAAATAAKRLCAKCGTGKALNKRGPATCEDCFNVGTCKQRECADCGNGFKTRNNSTRCSACAYKRRKVMVDRACKQCGTVIDYRSLYCPTCAPKRPGTGRPIGSRRVVHEGYVEIKTGKGWLREHVHVMEEVIGRRLLPGESAHHMNGMKDDNRPENLELWAKTQPAGQRAVDLLAWAREIVERYGSLPL